MADGETINKTSSYNQGKLQIQRLHNLWLDTHRHSRNGSYEKWNMDLDRLWCELAKDLDDDQYDKWKKDMDEIEKELSKHGAIQDNPEDGFKGPSTDEISKRNKQYNKLMKKDLLLRRLENFLGKGTKWRDSNAHDI